MILVRVSRLDYCVRHKDFTKKRVCEISEGLFELSSFTSLLIYDKIVYWHNPLLQTHKTRLIGPVINENMRLMRVILRSLDAANTRTTK